jgi:hypothetical protein
VSSRRDVVANRGHGEFLVFLTIGTESDPDLRGYWRTAILDSDLSIIALVGENEYTHIEPRSVGDVNGDGLDEVWVSLHGYEGRHAGLIYWRGGAGGDAKRRSLKARDHLLREKLQRLETPVALEDALAEEEEHPAERHVACRVLDHP